MKLQLLYFVASLIHVTQAFYSWKTIYTNEKVHLVPDTFFVSKEPRPLEYIITFPEEFGSVSLMSFPSHFIDSGNVLTCPAPAGAVWNMTLTPYHMACNSEYSDMYKSVIKCSGVAWPGGLPGNRYYFALFSCTGNGLRGATYDLSDVRHPMSVSSAGARMTSMVTLLVTMAALAFF